MLSNTQETVEAQSDAFVASNELDNKFFEQYLQNYYKNNEIQVNNFNRESATGKGENFSSDIYRVNVSFTVPAKESSSCERQVSGKK